MMIKKNKWTLLLTSLIILLPAAAGLILWDKLPPQMVTHWGADGTADSMGTKALVVFGLPGILLAFQWLCVLVTAADPKNKGQNGKMQRIVLWIIPILTVFVTAVVYCSTFGVEINVSTVMYLMMGLMLIILGNYLPKCKRNSTMGIKLPWTLGNDENWNLTHRLGGKAWVICGIIIMLCCLLPVMAGFYVMAAVILAAVLGPTVYSYTIYRRQIRNGEVTKEEMAAEAAGNRFRRTGNRVALIVVPVILIGAVLLMFTGNVKVEYGDSSFTVDATYWNDIEVSYDVIDSIEYREICDAGVRANGFGSPRLLLGIFENDEFGTYTRYSYTGCDACVVLESEGEILVIGGADAGETQAIYDELATRTAE